MLGKNPTVAWLSQHMVGRADLLDWLSNESCIHNTL